MASADEIRKWYQETKLPGIAAKLLATPAGAKEPKEINHSDQQLLLWKEIALQLAVLNENFQEARSVWAAILAARSPVKVGNPGTGTL